MPHEHADTRMPEIRYQRDDATHWLWEARALGDQAPTPALFDAAAWHVQGRLNASAPGRGEAYFLRAFSGEEWVLRHFHRGGIVARFNKDRYIGRPGENSRAAREFRMLASLVADGLPVPWPVAARSYAAGPGMVRADLITARIPNARPLADHLIEASLMRAFWEALGEQIASFHDCGVWHADLNARNVLVDTADRIFVIDFDKARFRASGRWQAANLSRLRRSLDKFAASTPVFHFTEDDWRALRLGYERAFAAGL